MIDLGAALGRALSRVAVVPDSVLARELAEERAAIMEYEGGLTRNEAEELAGFRLCPTSTESSL